MDDVPAVTAAGAVAAQGPRRAPRPRRGGALAVYLASAALVRSASAGAPVGLVTLTLAHHPHGGAALGGLLAALLTAPNVAGPWTARWLESVRDTRLPLAGGFTAYGLALAAGAALLGRAPTVLVAVLITLGGLCDPLMTGGLSSRLGPIAGGDARDQRRAEGWDSATYGTSNIAGPALVAALAAAVGPLAAVVVLGAAAVLAGLLVLLLPARHTVSAAKGAPMKVRDAFAVVLTTGPLRRVMTATALTAISTGGVMVVAVVLGRQLHHTASAGAELGAAYGAGSLVGALLTGVFPLTGEPERLVIRLIAANAVAIAACAAAPDYPVAVGTFALAGATSAVLFTASLAVRSVYSPPAARAHVFVTMASTKVAVSAAGTALAGALVGVGPRLVLVLGALVVGVSVVVAVLDRRMSGAAARPAAPTAER
jgi:MFS family permease